MENIHILPTDKPSRLIINTSGVLTLGKEVYTILENKQNIYITSDEEIKEGDWFILDMSHSSHSNELHQLGDDKWSKTGGIHFCEGNSWVDSCKKIILTTDQDLIKDGVQAIDDEFLEWFVSVPFGEIKEVEVEREIKRYVDTTYFDYEYKIIIPKEEATDFLGRTTFDLLKQEAIEEVVEGSAGRQGATATRTRDSICSGCRS